MAKKSEKIIDYISGVEVFATPEEVEAVQVFSKQLVEDYGYDKNQIVLDSKEIEHYGPFSGSFKHKK